MSRKQLEKQLDVEFNGNDYSVYGATDIVSEEGQCGVCGEECSSSAIALTEISEVINAKTQVEIKSDSSTWQAVAKKARIQYREDLDDFVAEEEGRSSLLTCDACAEKGEKHDRLSMYQYNVKYKPEHQL